VGWGGAKEGGWGKKKRVIEKNEIVHPNFGNKRLDTDLNLRRATSVTSKSQS